MKKLRAFVFALSCLGLVGCGGVNVRESGLLGDWQPTRQNSFVTLFSRVAGPYLQFTENNQMVRWRQSRAIRIEARQCEVGYDHCGTIFTADSREPELRINYRIARHTLEMDLPSGREILERVRIEPRAGDPNDGQPERPGDCNLQ